MGGTAVLALLLLAAVLGTWTWLRSSLPQLDGTVSAPDLQAPATLVRDARGSVTVRAVNRADLAYATGYAHAQDRFFQMDLLRRVAAGELSGLVGVAALTTDQRNRVHRFRARAEAQLAAIPDDQRQLMQRYADGANAGLASLASQPLEYSVLRVTPQPWTPVDTLLVIDAMYFDLQGAELRRVRARGALRELVPTQTLALLTPASSRWDVPIDGGRPPVAPLVVPQTAPDWLDDATPAAAVSSAARDDDGASMIGSNAWAVDGERSKSGRAMVANDMHLGLSLPNTWYRLTLEYPDPRGGVRRISGVSLPGAPVVVAGSNGDVAWGFTNSYGHFIDLIELDLDPADPLRYRGPDGAWEQAVEHHETIAVKGGKSVALAVRDTRWGPMIRSGRNTFAVRWIAHVPGAVDLNLQRLEMARDVGEAMAIAQRAGVPTQNFTVVDRQGHIGWTLAGPLPASMASHDGFPVDAATAGAVPLQRAAPDAYPQRVDPAWGRLWTANNRQLSDPVAQAAIGDGGADLGARASQIREALFAQRTFDERDLLAIQLDARAPWTAFWRQLASDTIDAAAVDGHPLRAEFKRLVDGWDGTAGVDAVGYTLVKDFYQSLYQAWFDGLNQRMESVAPGVNVRAATQRLEPVMRTLAEQRAWVPAAYPDWRAFALSRIDSVIAANTKNGQRLADARWGDRNRLAAAHPFARLVPGFLAGLLSAPADRMPGDIHMPRVQSPNKGASERFVVAPGHEAEGIMEMPGGASGHPLSPFFLAGHDDWVHGRPTPFLPGEQAHVLELAP